MSCRIDIVSGARRAVAVAALGLLQSVSGAEVTFPSAGGDLSSGWETPPGESDTLVVSRGGTYTASGDISVGNFKVATDEAVTFDFDSSRKITVNSERIGTAVHYPATYGYGFAPLYSGAVNVTLDGGFWDFKNGSHFYAAASGAANTDGGVAITGGAVVTNVYLFYYGEHSRGNTAVIDNAKVYAAELNNWATGDHNLLEIRNGGEMHLSSIIYSDSAGNAIDSSGYNEIRVRGEDSLLKVTSASTVSRIGYVHKNATLRVMDDAKLEVAGGLKLATGKASSNCLFSVENGAVATVGTLYLNGDSPHSRVVVSNATLNVTTLNFQCSALAVSNEIRVIDNGVLGGNAFKNMIDISYSFGNKLSVENSSWTFPYILLGRTGCYGGNELAIMDGAYVTNTSVSTIGQGTMFNVVTVSNATWTTTGGYVGTSEGGSYNRVTVKNGGKIIVTSSSGFLLGGDANAMSNRFEVLDGSTVVMENSATMLELGRNGSFNEAIVRESCMTCGYVQIASEAASHGNKLLLKDSIFNATRSGVTYNMDPFGDGYDNEMIFDGTDWDLGDEYLSVSRTGSNNVLRLLNGSKLTADTRTFAIGQKSENSKNNLFYIGSEASADVIRLRMMCLDSTVTVSNGTLTAAANGINLAYRETNVNTFSANNTLRLEGDSPLVSTTGPIVCKYGATLEVAIPKEKFAEDHIPIQAQKLEFDSTSRIKIEGDDFFEKTGGRVCLAEVTGSITLPDAVVTASLEDMPSGCRIFVANNKLYFSSPSKTATTVILK